MLLKSALCILLVDDNAPVREMVAKILIFGGYKTMTAISGYEGLHILSTMDPLPDMIIADIRMSGMNGYEFIEAVQTSEQWQHIPALFLSAEPITRKASVALPTGVHGYISKPFHPPQLLKMLTQVLAANTAHQVKVQGEGS